MCGNCSCCDPSSISVAIYQCSNCGAHNMVGVSTCVACGEVHDSAPVAAPHAEEAAA